MKKINDKGFTLIEILVVLGIIAVLTGLVAFNFNAARMRARDVQRKSDLKTLQSGLELYRNDNSGQFPNATTYAELLTALTAYVPATISDPRIALSGDDSSWEQYTYVSVSPFTSYTLTVCLENRSDDILPASAVDCGGVGNTTGSRYSFSSL